ncbi:divalent-cation tolerance protein CutA [candidate division FCPU426 bacterium]|nr:divalent-cation tolerance protein CutA [candidate division FCPU426 bacterium]
MELCVMYITVPNAESGETLAQALVEEKMAACVNRIPGLVSTYRWQGKIEKDQEELLVIKTRRELVDTIIMRVKSLHPYQVPEIIALPIIAGLKEYLLWVQQETKTG